MVNRRQSQEPAGLGSGDRTSLCSSSSAAESLPGGSRRLRRISLILQNGPETESLVRLGLLFGLGSDPVSGVDQFPCLMVLFSSSSLPPRAYLRCAPGGRSRKLAVSPLSCLPLGLRLSRGLIPVILTMSHSDLAAGIPVKGLHRMRSHDLVLFVQKEKQKEKKLLLQKKITTRHRLQKPSAQQTLPSPFRGTETRRLSSLCLAYACRWLEYSSWKLR